VQTTSISKGETKKKVRAVLRPHHLRHRIVMQLDETLVKGSRKKSRLSKAARPRADQVWVCGAVVEDHPDMFFFRVLDHPGDAYNGKPRGKEEMQKCLEAVGLDKDMILVTDKWKGTLAAVNNLMRLNHWSETDLVHEIVNHSAGEIVNMHGFHTNQIEAKWSVLKRWIRKRCGGRLPGKKNRALWKLVLQEFQWRKHIQYTKNVHSNRLMPRAFFEILGA
jgi:hypothetical protein